ncbi:MAG: pectin-derived oligosaccharide transport system substrate-binding protein [Kribbellaceae bacterium]|jgi:multiple sugar transport system substrate-binding protein|nr:pectin-derived oligosaccharide transport system substrate-binding protein [Kribbellaceae bacterium]
MRRKTFTRLVIGCATALVITACGSGSGSEVKLSDQPVTLRMTWWGADKRADLTNQAIKAFEAKNPKITIKGEYKDWGGYWDALATTTAAKDSPDVVQMDELYLASYAGRGALLDLGQTGKFLDMSHVEQQALATGKVDGKQYAVPIGVGVMTVLVNEDLFHKYGVAVPDGRWTWAEYAKVAKEITDKSNGAVHGTAAGQGFDAFSIKYWARQHGEELFDDKGKVAISPATLASMWENTAALIDSGAAVPASTMVENQTAGVTANSFATGKAAMTFAYNSQVTAINAALKANLKLLQPPTGGTVDANYLKPSMYWAISAQSKHPAEAAKFADFLLNDPDATKILGTERGIPANTEVRSKLQSSFQGSDKLAADYLAGVTVGKSPIVTPNGGSGLEPMLQRYTQQVLFKKQSAQAASTAFINELKGELDSAS